MQNIAAREQVTESALVRQLLETLARASATASPASAESEKTELRADRLSIWLLPDDRHLLRERAAARA